MTVEEIHMITLQNEGLLELEFIKTMGVHVKENEDSIGHFGTGLKYAVAVFLREEIDFSLYIGGNEFTFYTETKNIRGKDFQYCYMTGPFDTVELPFTTELGKNWELWQAYREIHSNCLDENGMIVDDKLLPRDGTTTFIFPNLDVNIGEIFLSWQQKELIYSNNEIEIYEGSSNCMYYKGIKAKELDKPSIYTYNILKSCTLTEDRLLCYDFELSYIINDAVIGLGSEIPELTKDIITAKDCFEATLSMDYYSNNTPTPEFLEVVKKVSEARKEDKEQPKVNYSVQTLAARYTPKPEPTPQEKKEGFLSELNQLCEDYGVVWSSILNTCKILELSGGILDIEEDEE